MTISPPPEGRTAPEPVDPPPSRLDAPFRWLATHPQIVDGVLFGGIALLLVLGSLPLVGSMSVDGWLIWSIPMFVAGAFLRTRTGWAVLAIALLAIVHFVLGMVLVLGDVMIFYALYCATVHGRGRVPTLALIGGFVGALLQSVALAFVLGNGEVWYLQIVASIVVFMFGCALVLATWATGRYQRVRVDQLRMAREAAAQAVREREQRTRLAVADERARIAREMHDVVAHSLSVIIAQADGGRFIASQDPTKATDVLETIGSTGRRALADMRSLLGVLRSDEAQDLGPQPGLASLDELVAQVRAAGLPVELAQEGEVTDLPGPMGLTLYRVVQEALTNVMKHAGPGASARVSLRRDDSLLALDVEDDGQGVDPQSDGLGHGHTGMRERVNMFRGTLHTGPQPAGGYRVSVRIPLNGRTR
ncbi:sensor histidine kinase [Brachybacterium halotolerans subsp. kimchii]|uniref:sensor histidine kinase n=1 Tax=Brachybacterium halotolerans TaxID=2795215 RepID=UPI001E529454|nr:sensor histidine kinase [Brachybacterium halotolerans]UEJ82621.1 sensor histidine kinase [Brachybacterium halotolerans subsp. kimchii]